MGIYTILAILFLFLVSREIEEGPAHLTEPLKLGAEA
jgi:hypothetical protein